MKKYLLLLIELILVLVIICQGVSLVKKVYYSNMRYKNKEKIEKIMCNKSLKKSNIRYKNIPKSKLYDEYRMELKKLQQYSNKVVGIIIIPGTTIKYPVLQGNNNEYYLNHDIDNNYNIFGEIFMDYRNSKKMEDDNIIIYGHNIKNRKDMFGELLKYKNREFFEDNNIILYITFNGVKEYKIFTSYVTDPYDNYRKISFESLEEKNNYFKRIKERSIFKNDVNDYSNQVITLSTCETDDSRMVVQGILIK
ncbi:class B sortase [Enterococcus cecorum]|uniref:class B sortase n=1 Tax=Enterococcus cecorum TaxID=44008 RepID=UPI00200B7846|nr:class B sortase [Enterococcus cecorum]